MEFDRDYDVVVAGAGVAGVAAALACARAGLQTALVEKTVLTGGLATTGLINIYLPLCDGYGRQVLHGIAEELLHLSIKYGPGEVPPVWRQARRNASASERQARYSTPFSPASFVLALDEALENAGVALWLDTLDCAPVMAGQRLTGIEVENKSGRGILRARCVIDATGDADIAYRAGAPCVVSDNWLSLWAIETSLSRALQVASDPTGTGLLEMVRVGASATGEGHPPNWPKYLGINSADVSRFVLEGRRLLREHYRLLQSRDDGGRHHRFPTALPAMAQFRTTRRIVGLETMTTDHPNTHLATSVGVIPDWRRPGPIWELPYGALVPHGVAGLLVAGRCIAAEGEAWEIARVIPPAALTGQIAGIVATQVVRDATDPEALTVPQVQAAIKDANLPLHAADIIDSH